MKAEKTHVAMVKGTGSMTPVDRASETHQEYIPADPETVSAVAGAVRDIVNGPNGRYVVVGAVVVLGIYFTCKLFLQKR